MPAAVRRSLLLPVLGALALAVAAPAVADNAGFTPVTPESPGAEAINASFKWVALFTGAILLVVQGSLLWFVFRYRRGRRARTDDGAQVHGNTNLELAWTIAPVLILVAIGGFVFYKLPEIVDAPAAAAGEQELVVTVKGYRFYWQYEYENGVIALDRMRAPADRTVRVRITAPDWDVIHSWWIPAVGGKFDAIPGHVNESWFRVRSPGLLKGQCGEFCGIQHAAMLAELEVMPQEEFDAWYEGEAEAQAAGRSDEFGAETYAAACAKCHGLGGDGDIGPGLRGNALANDPEAIEEVVRNGRGAMPPIGRDWSDRQLDALTEYLQEELGSGG